jgi:DNA-directed RNA polymerase specialized sigma24 family protein
MLDWPQNGAMPMFELLPATTEVLDEPPALELTMPQVFKQPPLTTICRGALKNLEWRVAQLYQEAVAHPAGLERPLVFGQNFQAIVNEFQPLFAWGGACWDYLLTIEGCRFIRRVEHERSFYRGDYRAVTDKDYQRLLHRVFRQCVLDFVRSPDHQLLSSYLRAHFWNAAVAAYRRLELPDDPRQRRLTAYSYLRCVPYQFFNPSHQDLVARTLEDLPRAERRILRDYFLHFQTIRATAEATQLSDQAVHTLLYRGLVSLVNRQRLTYCLLRQIERY